MSDQEVRCPLCRAPIPVPASDQPNAQGLSLGIDDTLVEEHIAMHKACTCLWSLSGLERIDPGCIVHASPFTDEAVTPDLFPDEVPD